MTIESLTMDEAVIAATFERISQSTVGRPWIEILVDWQRCGKPETTDEMKIVMAEISREIKLYVGDKAAVNIELPMH